MKKDFIHNSRYLRSKVLKVYGESLRENESTTFTLANPLFVCNPLYPRDSVFYFPDLPGAEIEIKNALKFANRKYTLLQGENARKDSVIKYMSGSDMAYFATHGVANAEDPMSKSFLVLSGENSFLTSREIQDLRLNPDFVAPEMVILSACQTGLGKSVEAGIAGSLARSFILSGSLFVIESLWNVDDMATAYLMNRFIFHLQQKTKYLPSGALRLAIIDTKNKYPNPLYWASFSSFGTSF